MDFEKLITILPKDPIQWDTKDIQKWLEFINLKEFYPNFEKYSVDGSILASLTDQDLQNELLIESKLMRKKIITWVNIGFAQYSNYLEESNQNKNKQLNFKQFHSKIQDQQGIHLMQQQIIESQLKSQNCSSSNSNIQSNSSSAQKLKQNNILQLNKNKPQSQENQALDFLESDIGNLNIEKQNQQFLKNKKQSSNEIELEQDNFEQNSNNDSFDLKQIEFEMKQNKFYKKGKLSENTGSNIKNQQEAAPQNQDNEIQKQQQQIIEKEKQKEFHLNNLQNIEIKQDQKYELLIEPCETQQHQWYCVKQDGLKIGRHSKNELLLLEESISRYHAEINYDEEQNIYLLQDLGSTTGTFIRIDKVKQLNIQDIFEAGSCQFCVLEIQNNQVRMVIFEGLREGEQFILDFQDIDSYTIGRKSSNFIFIEDAHLSQVHSKLMLQDNQLLLQDMGSTNGTWYRLSHEGVKSEPYFLNNLDKFKIGVSSTFQCQYQLQQESQEINNSQCCKICFDNPVDSVILPCKHSLTCLACTKNQKQCPICRVKIEDVVRKYNK